MSGETWVGFGQHRNEGTFGHPSSHHRHFAAGCFPAVSGLMQCRPPETTVVLSQHGLLSRPRPRESFSPMHFFPRVQSAPRSRQRDPCGTPRYSEARRSVKMSQDLAHAFCFSPARSPACKQAHIVFPTENKCLSEMTFQYIPNWEPGPRVAKGKGRQVHLLTHSVRMWRSWARSPTARASGQEALWV